jgi:N-acetylmuramic acid 6-phosphate etherase
MVDELIGLTTEKRNPKTVNLDLMSTTEIATIMNYEDGEISKHIQPELPMIIKAAEAIVESFKKGGRLIYIGAGTSGRLGVLDAAECVPTFGIEPGQVQGLIAGGMKAMTIAIEGAEDSMTLAAHDLTRIHLNASDIVVGIAASGRTPYVIGGLKEALKQGCQTVSLACNLNAEMNKYAEININVDVGPEILSGSTRLKAGTAQKMILNMLSTISMVKIGKAFGNLMVDVKPTNEKLVERSKRIIALAGNISLNDANKYFELAQHDCKLAIVMCLTGLSADEARNRLKHAHGFVRQAIKGS